MKKLLISALCVLLALGGVLVSCDATAEEKVFEKQEVTETKEESYAKLLGTPEEKRTRPVELTNLFANKVWEVLKDNKLTNEEEKCEAYVFTVEFLANQPFEPTAYIVSTEDSPYKAWVEIQVAKDSDPISATISIKTNASKFLANENCSRMFCDMMQYCSRGIDSIDFNNVFDTSKVINMSRMFQMVSMEDLDLSCFDTSNVTDMSYMFSNTNIENLKLSSFNTSKVTTMYAMFNKVEVEDVSIDISSFDTSNVTNFGGIFDTEHEVYFIVGPNFVISTNATGTKDYLSSEAKLTGPKAVLEALIVSDYETEYWKVYQQDSGAWVLGPR